MVNSKIDGEGEIKQRKSTYLFHFLSVLSQDIVSEHPERFFVSEIVREKIFMQYRKEIPYACQVCN